VAKRSFCASEHPQIVRDRAAVQMVEAELRGRQVKGSRDQDPEHNDRTVAVLRVVVPQNRSVRSIQASAI
jgi:hypothetical protein